MPLDAADMTVFDVYLNDRKLCRAGVGNDGVLHAIVNWVKLSGSAAATARELDRPLEESRLQVGGLHNGTHLAWSDRALAIGDRVAIVLAKGKACDPPASEKRIDRRNNERLERQHYLRLKAKYEPAGSRSLRRATPARSATRFLNVDLDIQSKVPLDRLVDAFGRKVSVLFAGRQGRGYAAHLEWSVSGTNPDWLVRRFAEQIQQLPRGAKALWNSARVREFNIGVQAGHEPHSFELRLEPQTVRAAASVKATIGFTVYGADGAIGV